MSETANAFDHYRVMVETSKYAQMIMLGPQFVFANQAAVDTFGFGSIEEFTNVHPSQISPEYQPDGQTSFDKANEMVAIAYDQGWHRFDWMHVHTDGSKIPMEITLTRMPYQGEMALFAGCLDLTDRARSEEVIRRTQKMDAIGQLTGGIAHDFNNILGIIKGNLEVLKRALPDHEFAQDRIRAALVGTTRGADLTRKLLAFSHEKARGTQIMRVNQSVREFESLIGKSLTATVNLELELDEDLWLVDVDTADFENVILNLALNARDAMPDGGTLRITTQNKTLDGDYAARNAAATAGEYVMIAVSDTGTGMSPEVKDKAFDPFFTTKPEGKGTGLGLPMVYGFVKQSGGHVKIYSEPGEGTTFRLYLPRAQAGDGETGLEEEGEIVLPRGSETVLAVDDEDALLEVCQAQLQDLGYRVVTTTSAEEALEILAARDDIDLLFSDVVMPGELDGFKLALRALEARPGLKVQLTSGFTKQLESNAEADSSLMAHFSTTLLRKPYNQRELAFAVRRTLESEESS